MKIFPAAKTKKPGLTRALSKIRLRALVSQDPDQIQYKTDAQPNTFNTLRTTHFNSLGFKLSSNFAFIGVSPMAYSFWKSPLLSAFPLL